MGLNFKLEIRTDATAAVGICHRRGLGKVRHLATADLWVQDRLRTGDFSLTKWPGHANLADALTKYLDQKDLLKHVCNMGLEFEGGRSDLAPAITQDQ